MTAYEERVLEGASASELVVALYDGIIRFLQSASEAVKRGDVSDRRIAVKRALDIIIHLQSRLRMDIGGRPAEALSDFYALIFAQILQASHAASLERFQAAISSVRNVRDAWKVVARENAGSTGSALLNGRSDPREEQSEFGSAPYPSTQDSAQWTA